MKRDLRDHRSIAAGELKGAPTPSPLGGLVAEDSAALGDAVPGRLGAREPAQDHGYGRGAASVVRRAPCAAASGARGREDAASAVSRPHVGAGPRPGPNSGAARRFSRMRPARRRAAGPQVAGH
jgi:hypothetical protein